MPSALATVNNQYGAINAVVTYATWWDTFTRTVSSGWGSPDQGTGVYTVAFNSGAATNFSVNGTQGQMVASTTSAQNRAIFNGYVVADIDFLVNFSISGLAVGATMDTDFGFRLVDSSNYVYVRVRLNTDASLTLFITDKVAGVDTILATATVLGITYTANKVLGWRITALGNVIRSRVWDTSVQGEPTKVWNIQTVAEVNFIGAGTPGVGGRLITNVNPGGTVPRTWTFDNLYLNEYASINANTTLVRVTPDGTRTPVRNSGVMASGAQALFWDDEAPLNTTVFYTFGNDASSIYATGNSNSVIITGTGGEIGWLKDPVIPSNDIVLNFSAHPAQLCATGTAISLAALGDETYADSDGEFDLINAARPLITTMVRNDIVSSAVLVSQQLSDITALRAIFASGRPLLLQMLTTYGWAIATYGSDYIHVRDVTMNRPALQDFRHPQRVWNLPFAVCNTPASGQTGQVGSNGIGVGHATYAAMKASNSTYAQLKADLITYTSLAQGNGY
jgi:hypothetical protein